MSSAQIYQVPVVANGLREPESILQIVDALDRLDKVFTDVYSSISSRVTRERSRIDNVSNRLNNAQYRVNQIVGSKSAITVFSSAKYPANKDWIDYTPLYTDKARAPYKPSHYNLHDITTKPQDTYLEVNDLVFIEKSIDAASKEISVKEGLGLLPHHIPSVSNLLLFNTQENPYKKYSNTLDNLYGKESDQIQVVGDKKKPLQAAPKTVAEGDVLPNIGGIKDNYQPTINPIDLPSYNFPSALPLPNVAENITWTAEQSIGIAPSNQVSASLPIFDGSSTSAGPTDPTQQPGVSNAAVPPPPSSSAPPPPPPPPVSSSAPPPPPPPPVSRPPPPPPPPTGPSELKDDSDNEQNGMGSDGSAIGNLLADIRRGHKNRLKKVDNEEDEQDDPAPAKASSSSGGGDFMSDLFLKLQRRRESIASTKKKPAGKKQPQAEEDDDDESSGQEWND